LCALGVGVEVAECFDQLGSGGGVVDDHALTA
jgi:hypothetical protein